MSADINYESEDPEVFVRKYSGEFGLEHSALSSIWEVEINNKWFRKREIMLKEEEGKKSHKVYKLRHFLTGKLMICKM